MIAARRARASPGAVLALACVFAVLRVAGLLPVLDGLEDATADLRFRVRGVVVPPEGAVIVAIDEATIQRTGTGAPLRAALAGALERIGRAGPAVVAVDLLLLGPSEADARLSAAMAEAGRVILSAAATETARPGLPEVVALRARVEAAAVPVVLRRSGEAEAPRRAFLWPEGVLAEAAAGLAHVNIVQSPDRIARALPLALPAGEGVWIPALPLAALRAAEGGDLQLEPGRVVRLARAAFPLDPAGLVLLNHYGPAGTLPRVSMIDLLEDQVDTGLLRGRAVFIGSTAESFRDVFATPFAPDVPGVEVLATAYLNLRSGALLQAGPVAAGLSVLLAMLLAGGTMAAMRFQGGRLPVLSALAGLALAFGAVQAAFGFWLLRLDMVAVMVPVTLAVLVTGWLCWKGERAHSAAVERERDNLSSYLSPALAGLLAREERPAFDGREQAASVLFVDVEGYTTLAEALPPVEAAEFLRGLHGAIARQARAGGAGIVEYLGDGAMLVWGLPEPRPGDAAAALSAAIALSEAQVPGPRGGVPVRLRCSLHCGPVAFSVMGEGGVRHVSVSGDTVNVAARLQDVAKARGLSLVVSADLLLGVGPEPAAGWQFLGRERLRGRSGIIALWGRGALRRAAE